jgi:hypothetical protein
MVSFSQLPPPLVYVILTVVASLEQLQQRQGINMFPDLALPSGAKEKIDPPELLKPVILPLYIKVPE